MPNYMPEEQNAQTTTTRPAGGVAVGPIPVSHAFRDAGLAIALASGYALLMGVTYSRAFYRALGFPYHQLDIPSSFFLARSMTPIALSFYIAMLVFASVSLMLWTITPRIFDGLSDKARRTIEEAHVEGLANSPHNAKYLSVMWRDRDGLLLPVDNSKILTGFLMSFFVYSSMLILFFIVALPSIVIWSMAEIYLIYIGYGYLSLVKSFPEIILMAIIPPYFIIYFRFYLTEQAQREDDWFSRLVQRFGNPTYSRVVIMASLVIALLSGPVAASILGRLEASHITDGTSVNATDIKFEIELEGNRVSQQYRLIAIINGTYYVLDTYGSESERGDLLMFQNEELSHIEFIRMSP
jgi:hypothetical protein